MSAPPVTTVTTCGMPVVTGKIHSKQRCHDCHDRHDRCDKAPLQKNTLGGFVQRLREAAEREPQAMDHDAAEVAAMVEFFSQPAGTGPPAPNTMKAGLLRGFYAHRHLSLSQHAKE